MSYISALYPDTMPHRAKVLYRYLKDRASPEGTCYPAINTIANDIGMSRRTVVRAIEDLEKSGYISKEQRWRENGGRSSLMFKFIK